MDICLSFAVGVALLRLPSPVTLAWEHSVEHFTIEEEWRAVPAGLVLGETRVGGLGAGVDIPPQARLAGAFWRFTPELPPQRQVQLANSRHVAGYRVCDARGCTPLSALARGGEGTITMTSCGS